MPIVSTAALTLAFLLGWVVGWRKPEWVRAAGQWMEQKRGLVWGSWVLAFVAANLIPVAWLGLPQPAIHDEFSYWLGADTLASGRLANPPIGAWENFETLYVQMRPTYVSIYPPGSAAVLAAGKVLFGHPYGGLVLLYTALAAVLPWALLPYVPFRFAMAATWVVGGGVAFTYWTHGYWGGALAALLGSIVVGTLGRKGSLAAGGLGLACGALAFVRPFEGALLVAGVCGIFLWRRPGWRPVLWLGGALGLCLGGWLAYNHITTGAALVHPYFQYFQEYVSKPFFPGQPERVVTFRHVEIELMLTNLGAIPDIVKRIAWKLFVFLFPLRPLPTAIALLAGLVLAWKKQRWLWILVALAAANQGISRYAFPHYAAVYFGVLALLVALGLQRLRQQPAWVLAILCVAWAADAEALGNQLRGRRDVRLMTVLWPTLEYPPFSLNFTAEGFVRTKEAVELDLARRPGPHLVFVKYDATHNPHEEWVYNGANLQEQDVVWARYYTEESRERVKKEFGGRVCWVLEPDRKPYRLISCE